MADVTLTADEAAFLAARLRRLFKHFGYQLPEFTDASDASLIRVAGSAIGGLLLGRTDGVMAVPAWQTEHERLVREYHDAVVGSEIACGTREAAEVEAKARNALLAHGRTRGVMGAAEGQPSPERERFLAWCKSQGLAARFNQWEAWQAALSFKPDREPTAQEAVAWLRGDTSGVPACHARGGHCTTRAACADHGRCPHGVTLPLTNDRISNHEQPIRQDNAPARDGGSDRAGDRSGELRHGATEPDGAVGVVDGRQGAARAHDASGPAAVSAGADASRDALALLPRIDAAIQRIVNGQGCMRIPADPEDPDLVLADCKRLLSHVYGVLASDGGKP